MIKCGSEPAETFELAGAVPYSRHTHDGSEKMCLNCWVDFVDFEDSELVGGSEVYALIWGLRIGKDAFMKKGAKLEAKSVAIEKEEDAEVCAVFFACEFVPIAELQLETAGKGRFRLHLKMEDVTGESDDVNTDVWIDGRLGEELSEMDYPE